MAWVHASHNDLEEKLTEAKRKRDNARMREILKRRKRHKAMRPVLMVLGVAVALIFVYLLLNPEVVRNIRIGIKDGMINGAKHRLRNSWVDDSEGILIILALLADVVWPLVCMVVYVLVPVLSWLVWILIYAVPVLLAWLFLADALAKDAPLDELPEMSKDEKLYWDMQAVLDDTYIDIDVLEAGLAGERTALKHLESLGNDCHIYTNLRVPFEGRESETDMIVVTPAGVTIVEVKNYSGTISGDAADHDLVREKNNEYSDENTFYNPIRQVGTHAGRLAGYLREHGLRTRIRTCVFFVHEDVTLRLSDGEHILQDRCPVFTARDVNRLYRYLENSGNWLSDRDCDRALELLDALMR